MLEITFVISIIKFFSFLALVSSFGSERKWRCHWKALFYVSEFGKTFLKIYMCTFLSFSAWNGRVAGPTCESRTHKSASLRSPFLLRTLCSFCHCYESFMVREGQDSVIVQDNGAGSALGPLAPAHTLGPPSTHTVTHWDPPPPIPCTYTHKHPSTHFIQMSQKGYPDFVEILRKHCSPLSLSVRPRWVWSTSFISGVKKKWKFDRHVHLFGSDT